MYSLEGKEELELYKCLFPNNNIIIIMRGSSWCSDSDCYRSAYRHKGRPRVYSYTLSFRCIRKVKNEC